MSIQFDNATLGGGSGSSFTYAHNNIAGDILFVGFTHNGTTSTTGVTYNGVAMTNINNQRSGDTDSDLWYLIAPATGSHNVVISLAGTTTFIRSAAASYIGARQTSQPDNSAQGSSTTPITSVITPTTDKCWHVVFVSDASQALSAGASTTMRGAAGNEYNIFDGNADIAAGATSTLTVTNSSQAMQANGATFAPVPTAGFLLFF